MYLFMTGAKFGTSSEKVIEILLRQMRYLLALLAAVTMLAGPSGVLAARLTCQDCPPRSSTMVMAPVGAAMPMGTTAPHGDHKAPPCGKGAACMQLCAQSLAAGDVSPAQPTVFVPAYERASFGLSRLDVLLNSAPPGLERPPKSV